MSKLKVDLDVKVPERLLKSWIETRQAIIHALGYSWHGYDVFATHRGYHIYIYIKEKLPDEEENNVQFLLGDDHHRFKINSWRIARGVKRWNKLFHEVIYRRKRKAIVCPSCKFEIDLG